MTEASVGHGDRDAAQIQDLGALRAEGRGIGRLAGAGDDIDEVEVPLAARPGPAAGDGVGPGHRPASQSIQLSSSELMAPAHPGAGIPRRESRIRDHVPARRA